MDNRKKQDTFGWNFENTYAKLPKSMFTITKPSPITDPHIVVFNPALAQMLGLGSDVLKAEDVIEVLAGNQIPNGTIPLAQAYAGHQFGYFTMLGDGRAILLGEQRTPEHEKFDIQLKGAGRTPYSRGGDGRATLGAMLREYIISEAMHALFIPTTRSLAVVAGKETVLREQEEQGAVLTRVAASHLRVGTFEYIHRWGTIRELRTLADYAIKRHFPQLVLEEDRYLMFLKEVIKRQASLIAKWQLVGFVHGVMNTDNMTISGETIDYGPCAFMDWYHPDTVFSSIDRNGRYAYGRQPSMAHWNLARLAEALLPLLHPKEKEAIAMAEGAVAEFSGYYHSNWMKGMQAKLGFSKEEGQSEELIEMLLEMMMKYKADYTNTFRALTLQAYETLPFYDSSEFRQWYPKYRLRLEGQGEEKEAVIQRMKENNPAIIPRNHRVEQALEAAVSNGDMSVFHKLLKVLSNPYAYTKEQEAYATLPEPSSIPYKTFCGT